jgi:hypothetical protein
MKSIYLLISIFVFNINYAHKNVQLEFKKGKVTLITSTTTYNEEINKSLILAEYSNRLLDSLGYKKDIKIFNFQSDKKFINAHYDDIDGQISFFRINMDLLDIKTYLNFIHYIIVNEKKLDLTQPVDSKVLKESYTLVDKIISVKINRPSEVKELNYLINYSYHYKDNTYYFHTIHTNKEVYKVDNFRQIYSITSSEFLIFLNNSEFDLVEENKSTRFKLSFEDMYFRFIYINEDYTFIQTFWRDKLVLLNLKNYTITEDFYNKLN